MLRHSKLNLHNNLILMQFKSWLLSMRIIIAISGVFINNACYMFILYNPLWYTQTISNYHSDSLFYTLFHISQDLDRYQELFNNFLAFLDTSSVLCISCCLLYPDSYTTFSFIFLMLLIFYIYLSENIFLFCL